jgi:DNA-binding XRE family transcriptional regulator
VYVRLGYKVGHMRRMRRMTQEQLAEKANLSLVTIGQLESNAIYTISLLTAVRIAEALEIPLYKLFQFDDD